MAKASGGTRNYRHNSKAYKNRLSEYNSLMNSGEYDVTRSHFDNSGGFVATNIGHNYMTDKQKDKSDLASAFLAKKGYRIYLDNERTTISDSGHKKDGRIEKLPMDIKTINETGKNTIKGSMEKAAKQGAKAVILYQNTQNMTVEYVKEQIYGENGFIMKSPIKNVMQLEWAIVVGSNGHVHRHNIMVERHKRGL